MYSDYSGLRLFSNIWTRIRFELGLGHEWSGTSTEIQVCESLFPGYFISMTGKVSTVHAQCCVVVVVVVVVVIVVLIDITIDVYNYRPLKSFWKNNKHKKKKQ